MIISIIPHEATIGCGFHYTVEIDGSVVAICGTLHHARKVAEEKRKEYLENLIQGIDSL
jgi:hypothetical protein